MGSLIKLLAPLLTKLVEVFATVFTAKQWGKHKERNKRHRQHERAVRDAQEIERDLDRTPANERRKRLRDKWTRKR
jgi:hypothetical protein